MKPTPVPAPISIVVPSPGSLARTDVDPEAEIRRTFAIVTRIKGVGARRRTFSTGVVQEDDVVNKSKAYLYSMGLKRRYNRQDTPRRIRLDLTRTGIIP